MPKGYALYHPQLGYIGLGNRNEKFNIDLPYTPCGVCKALKEIIEAGGLLTYDSSEITWIKPLN